jgi:hypothetical protein
MSYYLRAFCTSDSIPPLGAVFEWAKNRGVHLEAPSADLNAPAWEQAEVVYKSDKQPFVAEINTGKALQEELEEFVEFLEDVADSPDKQKVLRHLEQSKAVVAAQLLGDVGDEGYNAAGTFLTYFVEHVGGLVQADREGFYEGGQLIVEVE